MKKYIAIFLSAIMILSLTACTNSEKSPKTEISADNKSEDSKVGDSKAEEKEDEILDENKSEEDDNDTSVEKTVEEANEEEITLYFVNKKYIETGDESLEKLISETRVVNYENMSLEKAIVDELMKGTENTELDTAIPSEAKLIDIEVSDKTAFVNFAKEGLQGGSLEEDLILNQIIKTFIELDNIDKVQFLIDGDKAETLMGHFEISEPFESVIN